VPVSGGEGDTGTQTPPEHVSVVFEQHVEPQADACEEQQTPAILHLPGLQQPAPHGPWPKGQHALLG
jgi:hypothetical protein